MTLIEVLAGLVVLGTLLASMTIARGRMLRQWGEADRKLQSIRAVDALVTTWLSGPSRDVPVNSQGALGGVPNCLWRTRAMRDPAADALGAVIVRVDVIESATMSAKPLVTVDFLLPARSESP